MFGKRTRFLTMAAMALGVPYAWFNENFSGPIRSTLTKLHGTVSSIAANRTSESPTASHWSSEQRTSVPIPDVARTSSPLTPSIHQLMDVLRFDITPRWVIDHWGRVSTVRAEQNMEGLRVPLVTGINLDDIAGSLTYYFDAQQRVRRIRLHGQTGDERTLVAIGVKHFGLRQEASLGAGTFTNRWNGRPMNVLRITHAPVVRVDSPNTRLMFELELNDLHAGFGLSSEFSEQLP